MRICSPAPKKKHGRSVFSKEIQVCVFARQPVDEGMKDDGVKGVGEISWEGAVLRNLNPPGPSAEKQCAGQCPERRGPRLGGIAPLPQTGLYQRGPFEAP